MKPYSVYVVMRHAESFDWESDTMEEGYLTRVAAEGAALRIAAEEEAYRAKMSDNRRREQPQTEYTVAELKVYP